MTARAVMAGMLSLPWRASVEWIALGLGGTA
jgi:hypothetical protein